MNLLFHLFYNKNLYWSSEQAINLFPLSSIIWDNESDTGYSLFKFYNKSPQEKQLYFSLFKEFYKSIKFESPKNEYILYLLDSPRMTHLIINEIVEAELKGYKNIILLGKHNVDKFFFKINNVKPVIDLINRLKNNFNIRALLTPCVNITHERIFKNIDIHIIGIQHGYGTWVEKHRLKFIDKHFNFGEISHKEFNNVKSSIAGYSPTKLFSLYPQEDKNYILYLSQGSDFTNKQNIIETLKLHKLEEDLNMPVIIKEHFNAKNEFKDINVTKIYSEGEINTIELMRKSSLVITSWSGAGVESLFLRKPTIIIDTQNDQGKFFKESGLVIPLNYDNLLNTAKKYLHQFKLPLEYMRRINYKNGEKASEIIVNYIRSLK